MKVYITQYALRSVGVWVSELIERPNGALSVLAKRNARHTLWVGPDDYAETADAAIEQITAKRDKLVALHQRQLAKLEAMDIAAMVAKAGVLE